MTRHLNIIVLTLAAAAALITACMSEPPPSQHSELRTSQESIYGQGSSLRPEGELSLGQGIKPLDPSGYGAARCRSIEGQVAVDNKVETGVYAFASTTQSEYEMELAASLDVGVETNDIAGDARVELEHNFSSTQLDSVFTLVIRLRTADLRLVVDEIDSVDCLGAENSCEFYDTCGSMYVSEKHFGGYVVANISTSSMSEQTRSALNAELDASANDQAELSSTITAARDVLNDVEEAEVSVSGYGFPPPSLNGSKKPSDFLTDVLKYAQQLASDASSAADSDDVNGPYGTALDYRGEEYLGGFLDQCEANESENWEQQLVCYNEAAPEFEARARELRNMVNEAKSRLATAEMWRWEDGADTQNALSQLIDSIEQQCIGEMDAQGNRTSQGEYQEAAELCHESVMMCEENTDPSDCSSCTLDTPALSDFCRSVGAIRASWDELMPQDRFVAGPTEERISLHQASDSSQELHDTQSHYCWLAGLRGRFRGSGERVLVERDATRWQLRVDSTKTEPDEELKASSICVNRGYFFDGQDDLDVGQMVTQSATGNAQVASASDQAAIHGLTGEMIGGAEKVDVEPRASGGLDLTVESAGRYLTGFAYSFGVPNPAGGTPDAIIPTTLTASGVDDDTYTDRANLAPLGEGICVLTKVQGAFDGSGEFARISKSESHWVLSSGGACRTRRVFGGCKTRKNVRASAICYAFDQQ